MTEPDFSSDGAAPISQSSASPAASPISPETSAPETSAPETSAPETSVTEIPETVPAAVPVPMSPLMRVYHGAAFGLSAVLSPYLVIPVGTVGIVASQELSRQGLFLWTFLSVFFSTIVPALYVLWQVIRRRISDVHVMEREQRGGPFLVAIFSSALGAWVMKVCGAPLPVWSLGVVLAVNGMVMLGITSYWKISMHVSVLSATVFAGIVLIPGVARWELMLLVPALIWARVTRGRHSIWQGIGGCGIACIVTSIVLFGLRLVYKLNFAWTTS